MEQDARSSCQYQFFRAIEIRAKPRLGVMQQPSEQPQEDINQESESAQRQDKPSRSLDEKKPKLLPFVCKIPKPECRSLFRKRRMPRPIPNQDNAAQSAG